MDIALYELAAELQDIERAARDWAEEHDGDLTEFPLESMLAELQADLDAKAVDLACLIKTKRAIAEAHKKEEEKQAKRRRSAEAMADRMSDYLRISLTPGKTYQDPRASIGWHTSYAVNVLCKAQDLPYEYQRVKVEPDKAALQKALKTGLALPGVALEVTRGIVIR